MAGLARKLLHRICGLNTKIQINIRNISNDRQPGLRIISSPTLKFTIFLHLSPIGHFEIADPSSMQDVCHHMLSLFSSGLLVPLKTSYEL